MAFPLQSPKNSLWHQAVRLRAHLWGLCGMMVQKICCVVGA